MLVRKDIASDKGPSRTILPDFMADSIATIDFAYLKKCGISACFVDLDDTVVSKDTFDVSPQIIEALRNSHCVIYIATNRQRSRDLKNLKEDLGAAGVIHPSGMYGKPSRKFFEKGLEEYSLYAGHVVMIGDRFIQDVYGPNSAGVWSLHVSKLGSALTPLDRLFSAGEKRLSRLIEPLYAHTSKN